MGWKNVKEFYKIGHIVQVVVGKGICIGSPYVSDLIVIDFEGHLTKRFGEDGFSSNADLLRYQNEMDADPEKLKSLVAAPDSFSRSIPVFTCEAGEIIAKECEELGWPNVTHDGQLMHDEEFYEDQASAVQKGLYHCSLRVKYLQETIADKAQQLADLKSRLEEKRSECRNLRALAVSIPSDLSQSEGRSERESCSGCEHFWEELDLFGAPEFAGCSLTKIFNPRPGVEGCPFSRAKSS